MVLVHVEMIRMQEALERTARVWEGRASGNSEGGYASWADRQAHLWRSLRSHAAGLFERARASHRPQCTSAIISRNLAKYTQSSSDAL